MSDESMLAELPEETAADIVAARTPPHSIEAEQSVLGGLLLDNASLERAQPLEPRDFFNHTHATIFAAISTMVLAREAADVITVHDRLQKLGQADACGGMAYLNALAKSVPSAANMRGYAQIVRGDAGRREALAALDRAQSALRSAPNPAEGIARAHEAIGELATSFAQAPPDRFKLLDVADLQSLPKMAWRIHSVLPASGLAAIFGPSGGAKTFVAYSMLAACVEGGQWFGYAVSPGQRCVLIELEGQSGVPRRVQAWERYHERRFPSGVRFILDPFKLTDHDDVLALAAAIDAAGGADVIVIDTLNRAAPDADENSSADMGKILEGVKALQAMAGGLVVLVHHSGKNVLSGMRGHSSLFAALDAVLEVSRTDDRRELRIAKVKDGEDGAVHPFRLQVVELGHDEGGKPISSCVVLPDDGADEQAPRIKLPKGGNQKIVLDALRPLFRESSAFGRAGAPAVRPCLQIEEAIAQTSGRLTVEPKRRKERAQQAITGLVASGVLGSNEGWIWLA